MKTYGPRQEFTVEDKGYIISNIKNNSLKGMAQHLNEVNPDRPLPVTDMHVYSVVKQFRRVANTKIKNFKDNNELDKAEKLQSIIDSALPKPRNNVNDALLDILYSLGK